MSHAVSSVGGAISHAWHEVTKSVGGAVSHAWHEVDKPQILAPILGVGTALLTGGASLLAEGTGSLGGILGTTAKVVSTGLALDEAMHKPKEPKMPKININVPSVVPKVKPTVKNQPSILGAMVNDVFQPTKTDFQLGSSVSPQIGHFGLGKKVSLL